MTPEQITERLHALSLTLCSLTKDGDTLLRDKIKRDIDKLLDLKL